MQAAAHLKHARISPRKVQIVLDLIRGKDADAAMAILKNTRRGASEYLIKLLKSAVANAENNFHMDASKLYVSECSFLSLSRPPRWSHGSFSSGCGLRFPLHEA